MGELLKSLWTMGIGLGGLAAILLALYGLSSLLPGRWRERGYVFTFLGPALIFVTVGLLIPAFRTIYMSLQSDSPVDRTFVGFRHYGEILSGKDTRLTVINNLTWVIVGTTLTTVFALIVARFADGMKGERVAKSAIFVPTAVSLAGAGIIWKFIYADNSKQGLLNSVTKVIPGLPKSFGGEGRANWVLNRNIGPFDPPSWAPGFNTFLLIIIFVWASAGISTVFFSAAIKGVPESLIEAAKVDGATDRQAFYKVTLPYIRPTIITVSTVTTISALKAFDIVQAVTGGRFRTGLLATTFLDTIYLQRREGLGSAVACVIFILVIPFVVISRRAQLKAGEMMA